MTPPDTLPPADLSRLLERWGLHQADLTELTRNEDNIYRVQTPRTTFGLRVYSPQTDRDRLRLEWAWLAALHADAGLRVPAPLGPLDPPGTPWTDWQGRPAVMYRWVEGEGIGRALRSEQGPEVARALGRLTAQLHAHARAWTPRHLDAYTGKRWDAEHLLGPGSWWASRAPADLGPDWEGVRPAVLALAAALDRLSEDPDAFGLIHSDLHFGNVVIDRAGGLGVVDFGDAALGHYAFDLALIRTELMDLNTGEALWAALTAGYLEAGGAARTLAQVPALDTATDLAFLMWFFGLPTGPLRQDKARWIPGVIRRLRERTPTAR